MDLCSECSKAEVGTFQADKLHSRFRRQSLWGNCNCVPWASRGRCPPNERSQWHCRACENCGCAMCAPSLVGGPTLLRDTNFKGTHRMPFCEIFFWSVIESKHFAAETIHLVCLCTIATAERCPGKKRNCSSLQAGHTAIAGWSSTLL